MSLLVNQPEDQKNLIFCYLPLPDLVSLGLVSKDLYKNKTRRKWVIQRAVDAHFYRQRCSSGPIKNWTLFILYVCPYDEFLRLYFHRLKNVGIRDVEPIFENNSISKIKLCNNGLVSYFCKIKLCNNGFISYLSKKEFQREIMMFPLDFINLDLILKKEILKNLGQYIYDLWKYAEQYNQDLDISGDIPRNNFFDFFCLLESIEYFIKRVFIEDRTFRDEIMILLFELEEKTKNSKPYKARRYDYFSKNSNQFDIDAFVSTMDNCQFDELDTILDVGEYLSKYERPFCYHYLRERFDTFLDLSFTEEIRLYDEQVPDFIEDLEKVYEETIITKKDKLYQLFILSNYNVHEEFELALSYRLRRFNGEIQSDVEEEDPEDYDY